VNPLFSRLLLPTCTHLCTHMPAQIGLSYLYEAVYALAKRIRTGHRCCFYLIRDPQIQEIQDVNEQAFGLVLEALNKAGGSAFAGLASARVGRTNNKEQYGLVYRRDVWSVTSSCVPLLRVAAALILHCVLLDIAFDSDTVAVFALPKPPHTQPTHPHPSNHNPPPPPAHIARTYVPLLPTMGSMSALSTRFV